MATKRISGAVKEGEYTEIDGQADDITELDDSQEGELRSVLNDLNADPDSQNVYVKVFKWLDGYDKPYDCFKANVTEVSALSDRIRREYGSGKYRINVIRNGKLFKVIDLPILAPMNQQPTANAHESETAAILRAIQESQSKQFEQFSKLFMEKTGTVATPTDPFQMMTAMMTAMTQMKEFVTPPQQNNNFDNFLTLLTAAQEFTGAKGESNFVDVLRDALKVVGPELGKLKNITPQTPQVTGTETENQQNTDQQKSQGDPMQMKFIALLNRCVYKASINGDPQNMAYDLLEELPVELVKQHLLAENTIDQLAGVNPQVNNYRPWFSELQANLQSIIQEQENPAT